MTVEPALGLNLYLIYQNTNKDYDTYDSAVVVASGPEAARKIHPSKYHQGKWWETGSRTALGSWVHPDLVIVQFLGPASLGLDQVNLGDCTYTVICASFNAG